MKARRELEDEPDGRPLLGRGDCGARAVTRSPACRDLASGLRDDNSLRAPGSRSVLEVSSLSGDLVRGYRGKREVLRLPSTPT